MGCPVGFRHSAETRARMRGNRNAAGHEYPAAYREAAAVRERGNRHTVDATIKGECVYCGGPATGYDHVVPWSRGGSNAPENTVVCCISCNASKGNRTPEEWLAAGLVTL